MAKNRIVIIGLLSIILSPLSLWAQERIEKMPYGDFESWAVRYIKESHLIGGQTKALYMVGPRDTVYNNKPYKVPSRCPWSTSNAHARAMGVEKASISVWPERRGSGWCCRLETVLDEITAVGIDIKALATGSLFTGRLLDPIGLSQGNDPVSSIDAGIPFMRRPNALMLDYKAFIQPGEGCVYAPAGTKVKKVSGHDEGQIVVLLQHRWEEDGHIYAYRVATASERISKSTHGWVNDHRVPIKYGDISNEPGFAARDGLSKTRFKARNSKGKMVYIEEVEWKGDVEPTHLIIQIGSGCQKAFVGCPGNIVWVDNIRLVY